MKKSITLTLVLSFLMLGNVVMAQSARTLVKSFNLKGSQEVVLGLENKVEVKEWTQNYLRVQISIEVENCSDAMLKSLIQAGRYNLFSSFEEGAMEIMAPGLSKQVKVGGETIRESLSFTVWLLLLS